MRLNKKKGFTLAEILITLSIIGIIAAILFPSILANYNERTLKAKRQALFGRMSQAMGEMADTFGNYESVKNKNDSANCSLNPLDCQDNGSALKFINEGLSKFYKIAAVCDNQTLSACDIPDTITREDGSFYSLTEKAVSLYDYNPDIRQETHASQFNTDTAAFMTKNGESILLFYNPRCQGKISYDDSHAFVENQVCVNMIFDLNGGKNKPNKIGQDIGYMTVLYNDSPYVVMPRPYDWRGVPDYEGATSNSYGTAYPGQFVMKSYAESQAACAALGDNVGLPSLEEGMSMAYNRELWAPNEDQLSGYMPGTKTLSRYIYFWTSTKGDPTHAYRVLMYSSDNTTDHKIYFSLWDIYTTNDAQHAATRCVYKD